LFFARAEIVSQLINDKELMRQLFDELKSTETTPKRRRDLTQFLREFCSFVHSLQASAASNREQFFKTILNNDLLSAISLCISSGLASTRNSAIEIISMIVDYNPVFMRDFLLRQARSVPENKPVCHQMQRFNNICFRRMCC
jgi:protein phosphatase-4 regulatory subunit 3